MRQHLGQVVAQACAHTFICGRSGWQRVARHFLEADFFWRRVSAAMHRAALMSTGRWTPCGGRFECHPNVTFRLRTPPFPAGDLAATPRPTTSERSAPMSPPLDPPLARGQGARSIKHAMCSRVVSPLLVLQEQPASAPSTTTTSAATTAAVTRPPSSTSSCSTARW